MKASLHNLNEVLTYIAEGMYDAEKKIQKAIPDWLQNVTSGTLKDHLRKYGEMSKDKRTKLKRIFTYLLSGPYDRKNNVVKEMLKDIDNVTSLTRSRRLRDVLLLSSVQSLIYVKETEYRSARDLALQLNLQTVSELLDEIIDWELEARKALTKLALTDVNQKASGVK